MKKKVFRERRKAEEVKEVIKVKTTKKRVKKEA